MFTSKLASKFLLSVSLLVVLTAVLLSTLFFKHEMDSIRREQQNYADSLAHALAYNAEYGVLTKNFMILENLIKGLVSDNRITHVAITDTAGKTLYSYGAHRGIEHTAYSTIFCKSAGTDRPTDTTNESILFPGAKGESTANERIGMVNLSLSLDDMYRKLTQIRDRAIVLTIIVVTIAILITVLLVKKITSPLDSLVQATAKIAGGDFQHQVTVTTPDEIGILGRSFNHMASELAKTTVSKDFFNDILQSMMNILIVVNPDTTIGIVNLAAQELLGYREEEMIGKPVTMVFGASPTRDKNKIADWMRILLSHNNIRNIEETYVAKDGTIIPILFSASLIRNKHDATLGIVFVALDMRERKKAETEKENLTRRLMQTEKMAAVGQLASGIAHEINNPLGIILGFAQSLTKRVKPDDPLVTFLNAIEREALRCKNIVQEMLTFSRVSKIDRERRDLNEVIRTSLTLIEAQTKAKHLTLQKDFGPAIPAILLNANQMQQVVINLCNNAIDAMPDGGTLSIRTSMAERDGKPSIELQIRDSGTGIPQEIQSKIFEPFFTTKEVGKGTGLGLSLVYEIIQRHEGSIELESEIGKGSVFRIFLPV